jgi:hypothetical protein
MERIIERRIVSENIDWAKKAIRNGTFLGADLQKTQDGDGEWKFTF